MLFLIFITYITKIITNPCRCTLPAPRRSCTVEIWGWIGMGRGIFFRFPRLLFLADIKTEKNIKGDDSTQVHATDTQSGNNMHSTSLQTMVTKQKITLRNACDNCLFSPFFQLLPWRLPSLLLIFKLFPLSTTRGPFLQSLTYQLVLRNIPFSPSCRSDIWWLITFKKLRERARVYV